MSENKPSVTVENHSSNGASEKGASQPTPEAALDPQETHDWQNGQGEAPDPSAMNALQITHRALHKFPELTRRYQKFIGTAAVVSSALIVLGSIAVSRRMNKGETAEQILAEITPDEIENAASQKPAKPKKDAKKSRPQH